MMKHSFLSIILSLCVLAGCGGKTDPVVDPAGPDVPETGTDWRDTYNGQLLLCLSDAYGQWEKSGNMPAYFMWDAVRTEGPEYFRAALALAVRMFDSPDGWWKDDVVYPTPNVSLVSGGESPVEPRYVPFSDFEALVRAQYAKLKANQSLDTRYTIGTCEPELWSAGLRVMLCRAFAYYEAEGRFPETIDTWETSYLLSTTNCKIEAPEVKQARDAAWKKAGVTENSTPREKAVAIFEYARDEWTWENYNNTKRGAVGTINAKCGNCCDLSHAVCAMARLSGLPARYFHAQCNYSSGVIGHVISQIYLDGTWYYADASNDGNEFGTVTFTGYQSLHLYESLPF